MPIKFDHDRFIANKALNETNITAEMAVNADYLGFFGASAAAWERTVAELKLDIRIREGEVSEETRADGAKSPSEHIIKAKIYVDSDWQSLNRRLAVAEEQLSLYELAVKTMTDRGNNGRSISARSRMEMENLGSVQHYVASDRTPEESKALLRSLGK